MVNLYEPDKIGISTKGVEQVKLGEWYITPEVDSIAVIIPRIGTMVFYQGKSYQILQTETYQEDSGEPVKLIEYPKAVITTICRILRVDDEGDDMGEEAISVNVEEISFI